jgi:hypothetical protein
MPPAQKAQLMPKIAAFKKEYQRQNDELVSLMMLDSRSSARKQSAANFSQCAGNRG